MEGRSGAVLVDLHDNEEIKIIGEVKIALSHDVTKSQDSDEDVQFIVRPGNGGHVLLPVTRPCLLDDAEVEQETSLNHGCTILVADRYYRYVMKERPRRKLPPTPGVFVAPMPPMKPKRKTGDEGDGATSPEEVPFPPADWCVITRATLDDELLRQLQTSEQVANLAGSYVSRQVMLNTDTMLSTQDMDRLFKCFQEEAVHNARLLFDFILDYHQKQKTLADSNMPNHPPVIWLLTELLKTSLDPVEYNICWLRLLNTFSHFTQNLDTFTKYMTGAVVIGTMAAHTKEKLVQEYGCYILSQLATYRPMPGQKVLLKESGVELIIRAMKTFPAEATILRPACRALSNATVMVSSIVNQMISAGEVNPTIKDSIEFNMNLLDFIQSTCEEVVKATMEAHPDDLGIQTEGKRLLVYFDPAFDKGIHFLKRKWRGEECDLETIGEKVMQQDSEPNDTISVKNSELQNNDAQTLVKDAVKQDGLEDLSLQKNIGEDKTIKTSGEAVGLKPQGVVDLGASPDDLNMPKDETICVENPDVKMGANVGRMSDEPDGALKVGAKNDVEGKSVEIMDAEDIGAVKVTNVLDTNVLEGTADGANTGNSGADHVQGDDLKELADVKTEADDKAAASSGAGKDDGEKGQVVIDEVDIEIEPDDEEDDTFDEENGPGTFTICFGRRQWGSIHPPDVDTLAAERSPSMVAEALQVDVKHLEQVYEVSSDLDEVDYRRQWGSVHYPNVDKLLAQRSPSIVSDTLASDSSLELPSPQSLKFDSDVEVLSAKTFGNELNVPGLEQHGVDHGLYDIVEEEVVGIKKTEDEVSDGHEYVCQVLGCRTQLLQYIFSHWKKSKYLTAVTSMGDPINQLVPKLKLPSTLADFLSQEPNDTVIAMLVSIVEQISKSSFNRRPKLKQKLLIVVEKLLQQELTPDQLIVICRGASTVVSLGKTDVSTLKRLYTIAKGLLRTGVEPSAQSAVQELVRSTQDFST
ncbi:uncharacterized protein LOC135487617 [Lineus longissimus]|uniref:uncharacterized protein LOC135487617 n=1 Tax=Lineus longissimus TaxID=88925 RepID=UPI002B4C40F2